MNLVTFIENRFQELSYDKQVTKTYSIANDAEQKTLQTVLSWYRSILKFLYIPKVLAQFICVRLKLIEEPQPRLITKMKEQQEEARKAAEELAKEGPSNVSELKPAT